MRLTIEVEVGNIDLEHMQESVTEGLFISDNVTIAEHNLIRNITIELIKAKERYESKI